MDTEPVVRLSVLICQFAADAFNQLPAERPDYNLRASIERPTPASAPYDCEVL